MRVNNLPVRYIGQVFSPNYALPTVEFLSLEHARQYLADLYVGTDADEILLFPTPAWESAGEAYSRTNDATLASHIVKHGPRGGIVTEKL